MLRKPILTSCCGGFNIAEPKLCVLMHQLVGDLLEVAPPFLSGIRVRFKQVELF